MLENNIGYIKITILRGYCSASQEICTVIKKQQGAKGIILDLRGNPGGLLDAAVGVSSIWLPDGKTVPSGEKRRCCY